MFNALASDDSDEEDCTTCDRVLGDDQKQCADIKNATEQLTEPHGGAADDEDGWETQGNTKKRAEKCTLDLHQIDGDAATESNALHDMTYHGQFTARKDGTSSEIRPVKESTYPKMFTHENPTKISKKAPLPYPLDNLSNYMHPFDVVGLRDPVCDMVISRGCMKDIMRAFEFNPNHYYLDDFSYRVEVDPRFGHLHIYETHAYSTDPAYGFGFEDVMSTKPNPDVNLYRCLSYTLGANEKKVKVLVHVEVDCVMNNENEAVELKTHKTLYETPLLDYWYQMVLGDTKYLVFAKLENNGTVTDIQRRLIGEITPRDASTRLNQLAHTLHWIKTTMAGHKKATLSMKKNESFITLKIKE